MKEILLWMYAFSFVFLMLVTYQQKYARCYLASKILTSFIFMTLSYWTMREKLLWLWLAAFLLCFLGDILLGMNESKEEGCHFVWGLVSFAAGHLFFILKMNEFVGFQMKDLFLPLLLCLVTFYLIRLPKFHVGRHKSAVLIYAWIVTLLCVKGYDMLMLENGFQSIFYGCILFFISDFILLFIYFYEDKCKMMKFLNLLLYYSAVALLACSSFV